MGVVVLTSALCYVLAVVGVDDVPATDALASTLAVARVSNSRGHRYHQRQQCRYYQYRYPAP